MGNSLFTRKSGRDKVSIVSSQLEDLEKEQQRLTQRRARINQRRRSIFRALLLYGFPLYVFGLSSIYLFSPNSNNNIDHNNNVQYFKFAFIVLFPSALWLVKRCFDYYFNRLLIRDAHQLSRIDKRIKELIDEFRKHTDYDRMAKLISRFDKPAQQQNTLQQPPHTPQQTQKTTNRSIQNTAPVNRTRQNNVPIVANGTASNIRPMNSPNIFPGQPYVSADNVRYVRNDVIPPSKRSVLDKVVDYVLSDGANSRYALICSECYTHNGLVREEELGKIRFRCVCCNFINGPQLAKEWKPKINQTNIEQSQSQQQSQTQDSNTQLPSLSESAFAARDSNPHVSSQQVEFIDETTRKLLSTASSASAASRNSIKEDDQDDDGSLFFINKPETTIQNAQLSQLDSPKVIDAPSSPIPDASPTCSLSSSSSGTRNRGRANRAARKSK